MSIIVELPIEQEVVLNALSFRVLMVAQLAYGGRHPVHMKPLRYIQYGIKSFIYLQSIINGNLS